MDTNAVDRRSETVLPLVHFILLPLRDAIALGRRAISRDLRGFPGYGAQMRPADVQQIGNELAIKWDDGEESFIPLEMLRRFCPCASCKGEMDIMGNLSKGPERPLSAAAFELRRITNVGGYGLQPVWGDGHNTGIYSYDYVRRIAQAPG